MKPFWHHITKLTLLLFILFSFKYSLAQPSQQPFDWGLKRTCSSGFQFGANSHYIVQSTKYTSRNFRSALFNWAGYYGTAKLSINGLDHDDYLNWLNVQSMFIMRDTVDTYGGYTDLIYINGSSSNYARDFDTDAGDNYVVAADNKGNGWDPVTPVNSNFVDSTQLLLFKITPVAFTTTVLWSKLYGGSSAEYAIKIKKAADGNFIVLAQTQSNDGDVTGYNGGKDIWLLKISNTDGSIIWKKTIGTSGDEIPTDLDILPDGSIVISGAATASALFPSPYAGLNSFLLKLDGTGNIQWAKTFGGNGNDKIQAFTPLPNGGFVSVSTTTSTDGDYPLNAGGSDVYVLRHDANGNIIWKTHYGFADDDVAGDIAFSTCDSITYVSMSKQFSGTPQPYNVYPAYSQNAGIRIGLKNDGTQSYYFQESIFYPYSNSDEAVSTFCVPSMVANNKGGILCVSNEHNRWNDASTPSAYRGNVTRSFQMFEYGIPLNKVALDTNICKGQPAWGHIFNSDSTYSDTLRNQCNIDTLISKYTIHILNGDSLSAVKDTVICYGNSYYGTPVYNSFSSNDTTTISTICGPRLIIAKTNISVAPKAVAFGNDTTLCTGKNILLKAYQPALAYVWQDNSVSQTFSANTNGLYWVEVTDTFGCKSRDSINILTSALFLTAPNDENIQLGQSVQLIPQTNGTITWTSDPSLSCSVCQNTLASPTDTKTYYLTAEKDNCTLSATVRVNVAKGFYLYLPNTFTPNADTRNDILRPYTNYTGSFLLDIYNRYGERIFHSTDVNKGWDGTYKGKAQPMGSYSFMMQYYINNSFPQQEKGSILLIR